MSLGKDRSLSRLEALSRPNIPFILTTSQWEKEQNRVETRLLMGRVVNNVTVVSEDPLLISVPLPKNSHLLHGIKESRGLALHMVDKTQKLMWEDFLDEVKQKSDDQFLKHEYFLGQSGAPILSGAPIYLDCSVIDIYDPSGDHMLVIGRILNGLNLYQV